MLLHIGNERMISISDIVFILDINTCEKSKINQQFIKQAAHTANSIIKLANDSKSVIMVYTDDQTMLYYSPISSGTLLKRSKHLLEDYTSA